MKPCLSKAPKWATHILTVNYEGETTYWWTNDKERLWSRHDSEKIFSKDFRGTQWLAGVLSGQVKVRRISTQLENK